MGLEPINFNPRSHEGSDGGEAMYKIKTVISIHAPTRGATSDSAVFAATMAEFQSTLPRGERHMKEWIIHIPGNFNPRSHEGSDTNLQEWSALLILFQSTLPRGERQGWERLRTSSGDFNPRSHEGSDHAPSFFSVSTQSISIHAPTRGATSWDGVLHLPQNRFQSTLPRGERPFSRLI